MSSDNRFLRAYQEHQQEKMRGRGIQEIREPSRFDCLKDVQYVPRELRRPPLRPRLRQEQNHVQPSRKPTLPPRLTSTSDYHFPKLVAALRPPVAAKAKMLRKSPPNPKKGVKPLAAVVSLSIGHNGVVKRDAFEKPARDPVEPVIDGRTWADVCS